MYDLLIKGGKIVDPEGDMEDYLDVAISQGKIAAVARDIGPQDSQQVVDARDKIVAPGLIDMHCHVYHGVLKIGVEPDTVGVRQGVTTVVDGGSAGQAIFGGFPKYIMPAARTTVLCFLNLASPGLSGSHELRDWAAIDAAATKATIESNRNLIKGLKLFWVGTLPASRGAELMKLAKGIAAKFGLPVMVHIGDNSKRMTAASTVECLRMMEAGDIVSHIFTAQPGGILSADGRVLPELVAAMARGVVLDIAHGKFNFSFEAARKIMAQGVLPNVISSDVSTISLNGPVYGLTVTMSKLMALGLDLKQVIQMTTINPARAIGIEKEKGSLKPGMEADVSILELLPGSWQLEDSAKRTLKVTTLITPRATVKSGRLIPAEPVPQPEPA